MLLVLYTYNLWIYMWMVLVHIPNTMGPSQYQAVLIISIGILIIKTRRSHDSFVFIMEIPYLKNVFIWKRGPASLTPSASYCQLETLFPNTLDIILMCSWWSCWRCVNIQPMIWCHQATRHTQNKCWPEYMTSCGVTMHSLFWWRRYS